MNGNNNQNSLIVNPLKTEKMVGSANVAIPNTVEHFGTHTQIAENVQKIGMNWQRIRDFQDKTLGMNFLASIRDELSKFQVDLASKKETYQSDEQINALKQKYQEKVEMYKKIASEQGYDSDYVDAYIARANQELQGAENNFLVKNLKYQEEVAIDNYNQGLLIQEQTNERYMVSGNYAQGISGFLETVGYLNDGVKSGYIDRAKVPIMIKQGWNGMLKAHGESLINTPNGASQIEQMLNWNFNQFASYFSKLDTKVGDNEFKLGSDEFEVWKSGLRSAYASLKSRQKAEKEMTLIEKHKFMTRCKTEPFLVYAEINNLLANHKWTDKDTVGVNNIYYGTNFTSLEQFKKAGLEIIYQSKGMADLSTLYNDPNTNMDIIMGNRMSLKNEFVGGSDKETQDDYLDNTDKNTSLGSLGCNSYFKNPEFYSLMNEAYNPTNRQIASSFKQEVKDTSVINLNQYHENQYDIVKKLDPVTGEYYDTKVKVQSASPDVGAKYGSLMSSARKGDKQALRASNDILNYRNIRIKTEIINTTGGVITEDLAEEAGLKDKYIGLPISEQSKETQQKIYDAFTRGNKDFMNQIDNETRTLIDSMTSEFSAVDLGTKGVIFVGKGITSEQANSSIKDFLNENKSYVFVADEKGEVKKLEVSKSDINITNKLGGNKLALTYGNQLLRDENGKVQYIEVDK